VRIQARLYLAFLLLTLFASQWLHAQFQEPTKEELQMTSDPKAPGAAAVYLNFAEDTDDANHSYTLYDRIKVLTEKGKELATVVIPYAHGVDRVAGVEGRTIHSDGTIIPLTAKPADLMDFKAGKFQVNTIAFTLPSVKVGSILEYRVTIRTPESKISKPTWEIQQTYFVHKAHFSFLRFVGPGGYITDESGETLNRCMYVTRLPAGSSVAYDKSNGVYSLDLTDVPAVPDEEWMPPLNVFKFRVAFYYTNATSIRSFWEESGKQWATEVHKFTDPTGGLRKITASLVAPSDSEERKAQELYAAVQKLDNTDFSRTKSHAERKKEKLKDIRNAEDVWKQQSGSANDLALLYVALARAAGLQVWPMQVVDRNRAIFDAEYLSSSQLDDYLAVVVIDGKDVYLDPGQKMCPFGSLHWKHNLASGFRLAANATVLAMTPAITYQEAVVQRIADLTIDPEGNVTGTLRVVMSGPQALYWRQLALQNDPDEVKKQFNESMRAYVPDGVQADFDQFLALEDYNSKLVGIGKVSGKIGTATGKHFFLPGLFFESRAKHPFVAEEKRLTPVDVQYAKLEQDDVAYHLPPGFTVESLVQPTSISWPNRAMLKISSDAKGGNVEVTRAMAYNFAVIGPTDYPELHDFFQKVATADQQQIALGRAPAAKGD
jgi:Domain of Unknown Function with PDB structure (DUF3857)/Transglutaminase-like superfamily